jgi:hypothetical protein
MKKKTEVNKEYKDKAFHHFATAAPKLFSEPEDVINFLNLVLDILDENYEALDLESSFKLAEENTKN